MATVTIDLGADGSASACDPSAVKATDVLDLCLRAMRAAGFHHVSVREALFAAAEEAEADMEREVREARERGELPAPESDE